MYTPLEFQPLPLTWWPLARDCSYYVLTLVTLVVFMSDAEIKIWEAAAQFML
jgi:sodium/potassium/calcium exchanger 2